MKIKKYGIKKEATSNESLNPEVSKKLDHFIKAMAKRYDYSEQDAVYAIMAALKQRDFDGVNEFDDKSIKAYGDAVKTAYKGKHQGSNYKWPMSQATKDRKEADKNKPSVQDKIKEALEQIREEKPGLWANIRAKRAKGAKPSHGNSNAHKDAVKAGKKINKSEGTGKSAAELKSHIEALSKARAQAASKGQTTRLNSYHKEISKAQKQLKKLAPKQEGLWANINAKKKAGKKASHGNSNAHKAAEKAGNKLK